MKPNQPTDPSQSEIVPNKGEINCVHQIYGNLSPQAKGFVDELALLHIVIYNTRHNGQTAEQIAGELATSETKCQRLQASMQELLGRELEWTKAKLTAESSLVNMKKSLESANQVIKATEDYFSARNLGSPAENIRGKLAGWLASRQAPPVQQEGQGK